MGMLTESGDGYKHKCKNFENVRGGEHEECLRKGRALPYGRGSES